MLPLISDEKFELDDLIVMPDAKARLIAQSSFSCYLLRKGKIRKISLETGVLTNAERDIILAGSLINYYAENAKKED